MKLLHLLSVVVVLSLLQQQGGATCCSGLPFCFKFFDFPHPECAETQEIVMKVYTRNNPNNGQPVTRDFIPSVFNGNLLTMFIVHGYMSHENKTWVHSMKDAALKQGDYNVIIVGWSIGAFRLNYFQSAANTRAVGAEIALVSNFTIQTRGSSRSRQYCVGHSLGSHACGHAGNYGQFGRITGLDPAGPAFDSRSPMDGLNPTSADLVDVIHTNGGILPRFGFGTLRPLGHIDFYPNGGSKSPGCELDFELLNVIDLGINDLFARIKSSLKIDLEKITCSHRGACDLFTESILTPCFVSRDVCTDPKNIPGSCKSNGTVLQSLGFYANTFPGRGIFYLKTNPSSPFCQH